MEKFDTLYSGGSAEIEEKKSRFIATLQPVASEEEAAGFIARMKKQYWDASHNCSAFVLGENGEFTRCSDDGEPSGTAGRPMLDVLTRRKITNAVVVVTRYFGGTLLGTGGLVRAYQSAVNEALKECVVLHKTDGVIFTIVCDYNDLGKLQYLAAQKGYRILDSLYADTVTLKLLVDSVNRDDAISVINDSTAAHASFTDEENVSYSLAGGEVLLL